MTEARPSFSIARCLYIRSMGAMHFIAFLSLWVQIHGLIGSQGILPARTYLEAAASQLGAERFLLLPTLCWISSSDIVLNLLCAAGAASGVLVLFGVAPAPLLTLAWALYLSLVTIGQTFLRFQWDALLLEAGFLAIFVAPWRRCRLPCDIRGSWIPHFLVKLLLFRLMFCSGVVKLTSGDETWRDLTALTLHYMTQPLPPWTAWYAHHLPAWFHALSTGVMYAIEIVVPFGLFGPVRIRRATGAILILFQLLIMSTGNYGFFNLLTIALCLVAFDDTDAAWPIKPGTWRIAMAPAAALALAGAVHVIDAVAPDTAWPAPISAVLEAAAPFHLVNGYGLFRVMTTRRLEITVEWSADGAAWAPYQFKWKPGDPDRRPAFMIPHMPRLDWQMWFAALGTCRSNVWFQHFLYKLQTRSPDVLALLESAPGSAPPRFLRAVIREYDFTAAGTDEGWWTRGKEQPYCPVLSESGWIPPR